MRFEKDKISVEALIKNNVFGVSSNKWIDYMYSAKPVIISYSGYKSLINDPGCGRVC